MNAAAFMVVLLLVGGPARAEVPAASAGASSAASSAAPPAASSAEVSAASSPAATAGATESPSSAPSSEPAPAPVPPSHDMAKTEQPRAFGHVIGDVLTQRVLLERAGQAVTPTALPPADRVGRWFERRAPRIEADAGGRRWLVLEYQVINAPRALTLATLPALALVAPGGGPLGVPAWPVSIGPLTGPDATAGDRAWPMQPDRAAALTPTEPIMRQLLWALGALALVLVAWSGWYGWRQWREARNLPFAHALQQVKRRGATEPASWQALHQALNRSAGHVVHSASLERLFAQAPHLQPLRADLEAFFAASNARFFGAAPSAPPASAFPLLALTRALHAVERRHQR